MIDIPPRLFERFPDAYSVRGPQRCPHCEGDTVYNFLTAQHIPLPADWAGVEACGYGCVRCDFANAGTRTVKGEANEDE